MSDLETLRDHARTMATADHTTDCYRPRPHPWSRRSPDPDCGGCITASDRRLWQQIAEEIDEHLTPESDDEGLFA